jgi:hypothetical protein
MISRKESIILVPGLFGFGRLGSIRYFDTVSALLARFTGIKAQNREKAA